MASADELTRLRILADYGVMDTAPDATLDEVVALAAAICGAPIALVSLVDETRQWFKARHGLAATQTPRDQAFCAHAITQPEGALFTVPDARVDPRFRDNPLVLGAPNVVFYAGMPLEVEEGAKLGTLCVIDHEPRALTALQRQALDTLSKVVVRHLQARKEAHERAAADAFRQTVLASIGDAVIAADREGRVTFLNPVAEALTGWAWSEARGRPMAEVFRIVHERTRATAESPVERVLREGVVVGMANHTVLLRPDGSEVTIEDSAAPIRLPDGAMTGVVLVFRDATEERRFAAERERLLGEARVARAEAQAQRAHLHDTFMRAPVAIAMLEGPEHTFTLANAAYRALVNGRDVAGKALLEALPDLRGQGFDRLLDRVKATGEPFSAKEMAIALEHHAPGEALLLDFTYTPMRDADGAVTGVIVSAVDVTEQVTARWKADALAAREADARALAEQASEQSDFLLDVARALGEDLDLPGILRRLVGAIVPRQADVAGFWMPDERGAWRRVVHAPRVEAIERAEAATADAPAPPPVREVVATGRAVFLDVLNGVGPIDAAYRELLRQVGVRQALYVPVCRAHETLAVLTLAALGEREFSPGAPHVFRAVAQQAARTVENARLHAEAGRLREVAEQATRAKDHFLARVSHDLRNPLNSILGWTAILRGDRADPARTAKGVEVIERNARAQVQLVDDLLDVARIAEGKVSLSLALVPVRPALDAALDAARLAARAKGVVLLLELEGDIGAVPLDAPRFQQVIWNLASNAVKFTPSGGTVRVVARRDGSELEVRVVDTGRGIAPSFLPHVFERFEQADAGTERSGGLGLGLNIARHLVELHGGTIDVESEGEGLGACFVVRLPVAHSSLPKSE